MKKAYLVMIKKALEQGLTISVHDGEVWEVKRSTSYQAIKDCIESVEVAEVRIRNQAGEVLGWAQIIPDLDPEETISDHTYNALICELCGTEYETA
jgi:hypothetical protein